MATKNILFLCTTILIIALFGNLSCSNSYPTDDDSNDLPKITLSQSSGIPGERIVISGMTVQPEQFTGYTVRIGSIETSVLNDGHGVLWFYVPIVFDSTILWHNPPAGAQAVTLLQDDIEVTQTNSNFTILELAAFDATDSLINDPDGFTLLSALAGLEQDSVIIGIIDAIYASSGTEQYIAEHVSQLTTVSQKYSTRTQLKKSTTLNFYFDDTDLATLMQIGNVVTNFGTNFLSDFSNDLGTMGPIGEYIKKLSADIPYFKAAQTRVEEFGGETLKSIKKVFDKIERITSIIEFIINRVVASVVPRNIDSIRIEVDPDSLQPGDETDTLKGWIYASNVPDTV